MFALEDVLLEKQVISNRREIDWPTVEYYKYFVIRKYTDFQCDQKAFQSFKKHYNDRLRKFQNRRQPVDLDPLKDLLHQARDGLVRSTLQAPPSQASVAPPPSLQAPFISDNLKLVCELLSKFIAYFKVEFRDLKQQVLANVAEQRPEGGCAAQGWCASTPDLYKQVIQSVSSKRPFVRARQRVALCTLYISGLTAPKLLGLTVRHLKELRQSAQVGSTTFTSPLRLRVQPSEAIKLVACIIEELDILISDVSDDTRAFRAHSHSVNPCPRESLVKELNNILGHFKLSTKSWRTMP